MNRNRLFYRTRQIGFLWKSALALGAALILAGAAVSLLKKHEVSPVSRLMTRMMDQVDSGVFQDPGNDAVFTTAIEDALRDCLAGNQPFYKKLEEMAFIVLLSDQPQSLALPGPEALPNLPTNEYAVATAFVQTCAVKSADQLELKSPLKSSDAFKQLEALAAVPVPYASYALALVYGGLEPTAAVEALRREIDRFGEPAMREKLVSLYMEEKKTDDLLALKDDPAYAPYIDSYVLQEIALSNMDWPGLVRTLIPAAYEQVDPAMVILALISGLMWMTVILRFNGPLTLRARPVLLALPALLLGVLSAHAVILFLFWQEHQLHLGMGSEVLGQFAYCLSIGLREEGLKLVLFCPLIPFLRRASDLEILTVAGLVGLGFAIEENINYFEGTAGLSALGRFATANFLHISLTAMGGLTLARAFIHRSGADIRHAAATFGSIVAFHGLYDAFLIVNLLAEYSWLSFTAFVLLSYQYFGWLRHLRSDWRDPVSITSIFTLGLVLVTGLSYGVFAWQVGILAAFQSIAGELLGIALILIMFYREIPESLHG